MASSRRPSPRRFVPLVPSKTITTSIVLWFLTVLTGSAGAAEPDYRDVEYATAGSHRLLLDIYQPATSKTKTPAPLVIWVHGGAWRAGSKDSVPITRLLNHGFAIASVDYRLSPVAKFPAQAHDIKAAIRFLRAKAEQYHFDSSRFYIAGSSAGGHLAALVGVTNEHAVLEGDLGSHRQSSSNVQKIVSFYGASNLQSILSQSTPFGLTVRVPALQLLLGDRPENEPALAKLASPVAHVDRNDPPLLLIHGDKDPQMPIEQAYELRAVYESAKRPVRLQVVRGGKHGGRGFFEDEVIDRVADFLKTGGWK